MTSYTTQSRSKHAGRKVLARLLGGHSPGQMLLNMPFDMPHGQFFEEYLRRQRIALASPDHQEAMAAYREGREPIFSS